MPAVLPGNLIQSPRKRLAKPEIVRVDGQHLECLHSVIQPPRQRNFHGNHALVCPRLLDDSPCVNNAESLFDTLAACFDVSGYPGARQSLECLLQTSLVIPPNTAIGRYKEVIDGEADCPIFRVVTPTIHSLCELRHNINQHVFVVLGSAT